LRQAWDGCREASASALAAPLVSRLLTLARRRGMAQAERPVAEATRTQPCAPHEGPRHADALGEGLFDAPPTRPWAPDPQSAAAQARRELLRISADFEAQMHDLASDRADVLRVRLKLCTTVQELWHLRPELFNLIASERSQGEARRRLDQLDRHFPSRSL
jgi:hypothetical protein